MKRNELVEFLDAQFADLMKNTDASNNGLQVIGKEEVKKVAFAVDACQATFAKAAGQGADFVFTHHGISWGGGIRFVTGYNAGRIGLLMRHGLSLYAMHLPLDGHPVIGNNAVLAGLLGIPNEGRDGFCFCNGLTIGCGGTLPQEKSADELAAFLDKELDTSCRVFDFAGRKIRRVAIVSGGGAFAIDEAVAKGYDCLLTGEIGHANYHYAEEQGLAVIAAGHYATETTGPRAVMTLVQKAFPQVECVFVDNPTGL